MFKTAYSVLLSLAGFALLGQEGLKPLGSNLNYIYKDIRHSSTEPVYTSPNKARPASLGLPFYEDFYYSTRYNYPTPDLWEQDSSVYVNSGFPIAPPSIGVATFDGLNKFGYPYLPDLPSSNDSKSADTLTSLPIDLSGMAPEDTVGLSFYYQARGNGDPPEITDSLVVDMYNPTLKQWEMAWYSRGNINTNINDTMFKRGYVQIKDQNFLDNGFRFRIRNKATTNGDFDHWHVDYIYLDRGNHNRDTLYDDVTIAHVPGPYLKYYSAMPCSQYNTSEAALTTSTRIRYNGKSAATITGYKVEGLQNSVSVFTTNTNAGTVFYFPQNGFYTPTHPGSGGQTINTPTLGIFQPTCDTGMDFMIRHVLIYNLSSATISSAKYYYHNDTVFQNVHFRNYYAFDDGSAEAGYYVNGPGGKVAEQINVNVADTFKGVRIYFDPAANVKAKSEFTICVWSDNGGKPGTVIYKDTASITKYFTKDFRGVPEYRLKTPQLLGPGTYFIGFQQGVAAGIPVGFDMNYDHRTSLYYDDGGGWKQSAIYGSLLMRPLFGKDYAPPVGISEYGEKEKLFSVYPNPNNGNFFIAGPEMQTTSYSLYNAMGQVVKQQNIFAATEEVNAEDLSNGIYILILTQNGKPVQQQKIIVQH